MVILMLVISMSFLDCFRLFRDGRYMPECFKDDILKDYAVFFSGKSYFNLGEFRKAEEKFKELLSKFPKSVWVEKTKGILNLLNVMNRKKPAEGDDIYSKVARLMWVIDRGSGGAGELAASIWLEAMKGEPDMSSKEREEIMETMEEIMGDEGVSEEMRDKIASALLAEGDLEGAIKWASKPGTKAKVLVAMRRYSEALKVALKPSWIAVRILERLGKNEEAMEQLKAIGTPDALWLLAFKLLREGRTSDAKKWLRKVRSVDAKYFIELIETGRPKTRPDEPYLYMAWFFRNRGRWLEFRPDDGLAKRGLPEHMSRLVKLWKQDRAVESFIKMEVERINDPGVLASLRDVGLYKLIREKGEHPVLTFPRGFKKYVEESASLYGLPTELIFAVILAESEFNPDAISPAGAIGLMQIIPPTGRELAKSFSIDFSPDLLFEPYINISMGTFYLKKLNQMFGNVILALSAYNGGPHNVRKWLRRCLKPEVFVETIPFRETRLYVKRVLKYWLNYARIYGGKIDLRMIFKFPCRHR